MLIETGVGNKQNAKMRAIHCNHELLPTSLAAAGVRVEEVDVVINSHLHFDHCGWNTTLHPDGSVTPTFPNARYFAHRGEVEHGHLQLDRDRVSYLSPNYDPLIESGQMTLLTTEGIHANPEIVPGISVELFPGHTAQLMGVHIESKAAGGAAQHACYISDLIPTSAHLDPDVGDGIRSRPADLHRGAEALLQPRHSGEVAGSVYARPPDSHGPHRAE